MKSVYKCYLLIAAN